MANEIKVTQRFEINNGNINILKNAQAVPVNMQGKNYCAGTMDVHSFSQLLPITDEINVPGWAWFRNVSTPSVEDSNNPAIFIGNAGDEYGAMTPLVELRPNDPPALLPLGTLTIYVASYHGDPASLEFVIVER